MASERDRPPKYDRTPSTINAGGGGGGRMTLQEVLNLKDNTSNCYKLKTYAFGLQVQVDEANNENSELAKDMDTMKMAHSTEIKLLKEKQLEELSILKATHLEETDRLRGLLDDVNVFNGYNEMKTLLESALDDRDKTIQTLSEVISNLETKLATMTTVARRAEDMCRDLLEYVGKG